MSTTQDKVNYLIKAKDAYYAGNPIISDPEYDKLEDELRQIDPNNKFFSIVGTVNATTGKKTIKHSVRMRSMQKVNTIEGIEKWIQNTFNNDLVNVNIQPKIDGFSLAVCYENGKLKYAATRGNGAEGQDVTEKIKHIKSIPQTITTPGTVEIRGELYIPKDSEFLQSAENKDKPARNIAVGLINRKDNLEDCKYLNFVAYEILSNINFKLISEKLTWLSKQNFQENKCIIEDRAGIEDVYKAYLKTYREQWKFETDGLIVQPNDIALCNSVDTGNDHHNVGQMAMKPVSEETESELISIEWNVKKTGFVIPIVHFKPVIILNRTISKATGHNAEFIENLNLAEGDTIVVRLANDVIPQLIKKL